MAVYKEINRADGSGVTTFYRISDILDTAETDDKESQSVVIDYNQAQNKPSINGVALVGNKTSENLGLQPAGDYITNNEADEKFIDEDELEAKNYVNQTELQDAIAHIEHFHREIVEALPVTGMDNVLYMVRKGGTGEDIYNEYIWVGLSNSENGYEFLGTTATDLTDYYKKSQVDAALATKVDKEGGKGLSEENYTLVEKTKLAGLKNYDDTEIQAEVSGLNTDINNLKKSNITISNTLAELKPDVDSNTAAVSIIYDLLDNKMTAIRLVEQGDGWVWMNLEGSRLTYAQASAALGHENCMLFIEQLENDGKVIPAEYKSDGDHINVIFKDLDSLVHIMTCGEDDVVVTKDVTTTNGQVDFTVEDEAIGYTTKMTALYGKSTQATSTNPVSPSPDYPSPIESIEEINIEVNNSNFINANNIKNSNIIISNDGAKITMPLITNGNGYTSTGSTLIQLCPNLKVGDVVYLNAETTSGFNKFAYLEKANKSWNFGASMTLTKDILDSVFVLYGNRFTSGETEQVDITNLRITKNINDSWEKYESNITNINLQGNELCSLPNGIKDELIVENGRAKIIKRIGKVVLNGSENWVNWDFTSDNYIGFALNNYINYNNSVGYDIRGISNYFEVTVGGNNYLENLGLRQSGDTLKKIYICMLKSKVNSLSDFKTWLSTHNVEVYYALETPIDIEITDPTLLAQLNALEQITQYKHTYITITGDDLTPEADFTYINNVVINNTDSVLGKDTYWNDEVPTQQDLPSNAQEGEIRIVQDTEDIYIYNGTKWVPFDKNSEVDLSNYLTKDNTTPWVPTGPFNPSTKKYVDDSVGGIHIPTKTSQLQNDSDFVIKTTNELTNYYTKNNTYTKNEVDALVAGGSGTSDYSDLTNKPKINNVELSGNKSLNDLGITNFSGDYNDLSNKPDIPTKTSDLTNDSGFIDSSYHDNTKQDTLVSGTNIKTINNESILGEGNISISGGSSLNNVLDGNAIGSARTIGANDSEGQLLGEYAWAEGKGTTASGRRSHAEGDSTIASGDYSHAEGLYTRASGYVSHAEGFDTKAPSDYSHAEGNQTEASGNCSHAEGIRTTASSSNSHAEGDNTIASGISSHAEGYDTKAQGNNQHVQGKYNIADTTSAHIVGNGTKYNARSNAHTLDWQGNAWFAGDVYTGSTSGKNKDDGSKKLATEEYVDNSVNGIVESGSNNYGNWIKFEDGTMICTRTITVTIDCTNSWGSLYYGENYDKFNFAQSFIEPPILNLQYNATGSLSFIPIAYSEIVIDKDGFKKIEIARPSSATGVSVEVYFIAIGKWK